jgi:hypothetical protein
MSLELFVNFERQSNNQLFYRPTSINAYAAVVKLSSSDLDIFDPSLYVATYTVDNRPETLSNFDLYNGVSLSFDRRWPVIRTVQVLLSAKEGATETETYTMSAMFLDKIPSTTFVAYPSSYFEDETGIQRFPNTKNFTKGPGLYFYGEGHTESICLSAKGASGFTLNWFIGDSSAVSQWPITITSTNTATVRISSEPTQEKKIPINVRLTNQDIKLDGPVYYYDDITGKKTHYSFFDSSATPDGTERTDNKFKSHIHVRRYPQVENYTYVPAFSADIADLPFDYTTKWFESKLVDKHNSPFLYYGLSSTAWQIDTNIDGMSRASNWSYTTKPLPNINGYRFPLSYTPATTENIPYLKISSINDTTVTNTVSAIKKVQIQKFPYDWQLSTQIETYNSSAVIYSQPYIKLHSPNFFAVKEEKSYFERLQVYAKDFLKLEKVVIDCDGSLTTTLTGDNLYNEFDIVFNKLGKQTLSATSFFYNSKTNTTDKVVNVFENAIEVVSSYDDKAVIDFYHTTNSKLQTTQLSAPALSPNEWVTETNINSIFQAFYETLDTILDHTTLYVNNSLFYGWLGSSNYRWVDLVNAENTTDKLTWNDQLPSQLDTNNNGFPLYWNQQSCDDDVESDTVCLQKYCLEWKWSSRKRSNSTLITTWRDTRSTSSLAKKWQYEPCSIDSTALMCDLGKWHISTIDLDYFPLQNCGYNKDCLNVACVEMDNYLIVAKKTELNLIDNKYDPKKLHRAGLADSLFAFASIEGMCSEGNNLYVLDSLIPKVTVYKVSNNKFTLVNSWGRFGLATNGYGFNRPKDITIDQNKYLYITDTGNKCIKKYTLAGKHVLTIKHSSFDTESPVSCCVDSQEQIHVLLSTKVVVLDKTGTFVLEYNLSSNVVSPKKITCNYNRELVYVSHFYGIDKYFRTGVFFDALINKLQCSNGIVMEQFAGVYHNPQRTLYICANDKILKYADRMRLITSRSPISKDLYWTIDEIKIHKEEYIQTWVYQKAFHRLWDNIELIRNSLHYNSALHPERKTYYPPTYSKEEIVIGQNEIVTNSVINRLSEQLWTNTQTLLNYFK